MNTPPEASSDQARPLHWLAHLGAAGAANVHPGGARASDWMLDGLAAPAGALVLEVGCGTGETLLRLLSRQSVTAVGLDLLREMVASARLRLAVTRCACSTRLIRADLLNRLPFADGAFDCVYAESALAFQPTEQVPRLLSELRRVLRPGGRLALLEGCWAAGQDPAALRAYNAAAQADFGLALSSDEPWTSEDWLDLLRDAGFDPQAERVPADLPFPRLGARLLLSRAVSVTLRCAARCRPAWRRDAPLYMARLRRRAGGGGPRLESWRFLATAIEGTMGESR